MSIEDRIAAMAAKATKPDAKREAFNALAAADPDQAQWLREIAAEFGKPEAIVIRAGRKLVFSAGEFG